MIDVNYPSSARFEAVQSASYGLHWFRRDLRVVGNPGLAWSWKRHQGRVLGVFFFDHKFLSRPDFSHDRFGVFLRTLSSLKEELRRLGGDLLVLDEGPEPGWQKLKSVLQSNGISLPQSISLNRDYEPFARERDARMSRLWSASGIEVHTERDHLLLEPHEVQKDTSGFYQVYSPYAKRWFEALHKPEVRARVEEQKKAMHQADLRGEGEAQIFALTWEDLFQGKPSLEDHLDSFIKKNDLSVRVPMPDVGYRAALRRLRDFSGCIQKYGDQRDIPSIDGTSQLSIYLKNGSITAAQVMAELDLLDEPLKSEGGRTKFLKEIVWREFYYSILWNCPRVENESFLQKYSQLAWENREDYFEAWKEGRTGFPIVDAGMRQLKETGWMHNRVRMIVASFLTKDLLIDWKWGERYFMEKLLDGDLAPNNGGWQWAASTGVDPQPYFRIFNPALQSERFDPEGKYIRKYVPELRDLPLKYLHQPEKQGRVKGYPMPIVDHAAQKAKALALYKAP